MKVKKRPKPVDMIIDRGVLYLVQGGRRIIVHPAIAKHKPYRDAYRKLFGKLGYFPLDGKYHFTGKKMRRVKS